MNAKATARKIKSTITQKVEKTGNMVPSEIYTALSHIFPHNNYSEFKIIVKEMQKDKLLIPDIIYGGLTLPRK